jgi:MFS-type transporter involved in bile tolerance (Atg22 family)
LSVAVWWAVFSIPVFRVVPEPPAATAQFRNLVELTALSFQRILATLRDLRRYRELFKFLIAFVIYNDAIGTIIGVAAIYGAELGFAAEELILALLLVQFVGIPFSLIFGWLPSQKRRHRPRYLAFILFNLVMLPLAGLVGVRVLPTNMTGMLLPPYTTTGTFVGSGIYPVVSEAVALPGDWQTTPIEAAVLDTEQDQIYAVGADAELAFDFNGQDVVITYATGPDQGIWTALLDGQPLMIGENTVWVVDTYSPTMRYGLTTTITAPTAGEHRLMLQRLGQRHPDSTGNVIRIQQLEVLIPVSSSNLGVILGVIGALQLAGVVFALLFGDRLFGRIVHGLDTRRSILLALLMYGVIAVFGYVLRSTLEFWLLAWMVAIVQGGSQALSRSLYAYLAPASKSGEFFGFFGVMEKFSAFLGPLIFALAAATFGSSRPAVLALVAFFILGGYLLSRVDVAAGRQVALADDAQMPSQG